MICHSNNVRSHYYHHHQQESKYRVSGQAPTHTVILVRRPTMVLLRCCQEGN